MGGEGGNSWWSLPPSPSPPIHWGWNILDGQGRSPLAEGQLGFPLERREIMASLGEQAGSKWEGLFTIVSALGHGPLLLLGGAEYINKFNLRSSPKDAEFDE